MTMIAQRTTEFLEWLFQLAEIRRQVSREVMNMDGHKYERLCKELGVCLMPNVVDALTPRRIQGAAK